MKLRYGFAAVAAIAVAVPTLASAETTVIKKYGHHDHFRSARAEMRFEHRPFFHRFHRDRDVVIIKRHRHHWD